MQKITFPTSSLSHVKGETVYTQDDLPDIFRPLIDECAKHLGKEYKSYNVFIGCYGRENKTYIKPPKADDTYLGRTLINFGSRELYSFYEGKIPHGIQTFDTNDMMFLEPDFSMKVNVYVSATPRRKLTINGKVIANIRAPNYKRYTVAIDWIRI